MRRRRLERGAQRLQLEREKQAAIDRPALFLEFWRTIIEDDVLIGGYAAIPAGVHIKRGAIIRGFSMVLPGTVIGENEYWAGIPARKMREMPPVNALSDAPTTASDTSAGSDGIR